MVSCRGLLLLVVVVLGVSGSAVAQEVPRTVMDTNYRESLVFHQLLDGKVHALFNFSQSTLLGTNASDNLHFSFFPKAVGEIVSEFGLLELHLTMTQGRWDYEDWGYPATASSPPPGAQLWAYLTRSKKDVWSGLTNVLAGLFCASLNFIDSVQTPDVFLSFQPTHSSLDSGILKFGRLPREAVCTENLTPFTKLLPCGNKAGIASLLNAHKLFDGNYFSSGVHIRTACHNSDCSLKLVELEQTVSVVLDPKRGMQTVDWSTQSILDRTMEQVCPVSVETTVALQLHGKEKKQFEWLTEPDLVSSAPGITIGTYNLNGEMSPLNLGVTWKDAPIQPQSHPALIQVRRFQTGFGQERGGLTVDIVNAHPTRSSNVTYLETTPWILKFFLHTLTLSLNDQTVSLEKNGIIKDMYYQPSIDRKRPSVLELALELPPNSKVTLAIAYETTYLKYTEYPPDANRGFDIGAAVLSFKDQDSGTTRQVYTDPILIALPTPDFSMPYNVITLSCTLLALLFGSIFNVLMKRLEPMSNDMQKKKA